MIEKKLSDFWKIKLLYFNLILSVDKYLSIKLFTYIFPIRKTTHKKTQTKYEAKKMSSYSFIALLKELHKK